MMKYTPRVRSEIAPVTQASTAASATATGQDTSADVTPDMARMPTA